MRKIRTFLVVWVFSLLGSFAQQKDGNPITSKDSLSPEQIAIYRVVLKDYTKGSDGTLNLANKTEMLDESNLTDDQSCFKEYKIK